MPGPLADGQVLIAGGGIGGLTAAIALARHGIPCQILERAPVFSTTGAGIQLGPNATRILHRIGAMEALTPVAQIPESIEINDGVSGKRLTSLPLGQLAEERYGVPYMVIHRADLHSGLLDHARTFDNIMMRRKFEVAGIQSDGDSITVTSGDGATARGVLLIGADGLWSRVRREIAPRARVRLEPRTAWRTLLDSASLPEPFQRPGIGLWMAPNAHVVHYPVSGGNSLNLVVVVKGRTTAEDWDTPGDREELARHFDGWPEPIRSLVTGAEHWRKWPLARMRRLKGWSNSNIVLLGDAAHPVMPFLAQGAALAIEDAAMLATALAGEHSTLERALRAYEAARAPRAEAVQAASRNMGRIYHLRGVAASARNMALRMRSPGALLESYDWLYRFGEGADD